MNHMKKAIIVSGFVVWSAINANCQWYVEKYLVTDIDYLTQWQLEEALKDSKKNLYISLGAMGLGGVLVLLENLQPYTEEDDDNVTLMETIIGEEGMHLIIIGSGIVLSIGSAVASFVFLGRVVTLNSALRRNFPSAGSLSLSPALILEESSHNMCPGVKLTYNF